MPNRPDHVSLVEWQPTVWRPGMVSRDPDGLWFVCCPCCGGLAAAGQHRVTEYADGTVGFQPSLICPKCGCHYWVRRSGIEYV